MTGNLLITDGWLLMGAVGLVAAVLVLLVGLVLAWHVACLVNRPLRRRRDATLDRRIAQALAARLDPVDVHFDQARVAMRPPPDQLALTRVIGMPMRPRHRPRSAIAESYLLPEDLRE